MTEKVKCPLCHGESSSRPIKMWQFRGYEVRRYVCDQCRAKFNVYKGPESSYTIPKAAS